MSRTRTDVRMRKCVCIRIDDTRMILTTLAINAVEVKKDTLCASRVKLHEMITYLENDHTLICPSENFER